MGLKLHLCPNVYKHVIILIFHHLEMLNNLPTSIFYPLKFSHDLFGLSYCPKTAFLPIVNRVWILSGHLIFRPQIFRNVEYSILFSLTILAVYCLHSKTVFLPTFDYIITLTCDHWTSDFQTCWALSNRSVGLKTLYIWMQLCFQNCIIPHN